MSGRLITFDELPLNLTELLERKSFVRIAASAYRPAKVTVPWAEIESLLVMDGDVTCVRDGKNFRLGRADHWDSTTDLDDLLMRASARYWADPDSFMNGKFDGELSLATGTVINIDDRRRAAKKGGA